jgi:hypothetical protein
MNLHHTNACHGLGKAYVKDNVSHITINFLLLKIIYIIIRP